MRPHLHLGLLAPLLCALVLCAAPAIAAYPLAALSNQDASDGLKAALGAGSAAAVAKLGVENGFLNHDKVKITLPGVLEQDKPLLIDAVKSMSVSDAKHILSGGDTSVTDFFRHKTAAPLAVKFLPIVKSVTDKSGLSSKYNSTMSQIGKTGLLPQQQSTVEGYVTDRALDGVYLMIGEEEKAIRRDPLSYGSKIIGKILGSLK